MPPTTERPPPSTTELVCLAVVVTALALLASYLLHPHGDRDKLFRTCLQTGHEPAECRFLLED